MLFVACLCLLLGAVLATRAATERTSDALDLRALSDYAEAVFHNGDVAPAVTEHVQNLGDYEDVIPDRVSLVTKEHSIVFRVVGHHPDPEIAAEIANVAAIAFVEDLNAAGAGVGTFTLHSEAVPG